MKLFLTPQQAKILDGLFAKQKQAQAEIDYAFTLMGRGKTVISGGDLTADPPYLEVEEEAPDGD